MIPRYETKDMRDLWSDEQKFKTWLRVELGFLEAYVRHHHLSAEASLQRMREKALCIDWPAFSRRVQNYELELKHDVISFLHALEDEFGDDARLIHAGLTSSDVVDTAHAIILQQAATLIRVELKALIEVLWRKALAHQGLICLGRTHGQAAEPTTYGLKFLGFAAEFARSLTRLDFAIEEIKVGKFSGAVGTYAHSNPEIEKEALDHLELKRETVATQIVARDRHAHFYTVLAVLAGSIERLAVEIRLLMHGGVREVSEPFSARQKGSSAMPHKKNPILSENLCGLMRLMRAYAQAALENQALWHERDISHSSTERIIGPDATGLMHFALLRLKGLIENLNLNEEQIKENLQKADDKLASQSLMLALVHKGHSRKEAYEMVQGAALRSSLPFKEALLASPIVDILGAELIHTLIEGALEVKSEAIFFARVEEELRENL